MIDLEKIGLCNKNMDIPRFCRTCLRYPKNPISLHEDNDLLQKIEIIASIKISFEYSALICQECIVNVKRCYNFRKVIIHSDQDITDRLQQFTKQNFETKYECEIERNIEQCNGNQRKNIEGKEDKYILETNDSDGQNYMSDNTEDNPISQTPIEENDVIRKLLNKCRLWKCSVCKQTFESRLNLKTHKTTEHIAKGMCNICGLVIRKDNLPRHVKMHGEKPLKCEVCGKVCKNSGSMRTHKLQHRGLSYPCEICGKIYTTTSLYNMHIKRQHTNPESRKTACPVCGKKVNRLSRHMITHTGERSYTCSYCNKALTTPTALRTHIRKHTNERPFVCSYCPSAFTQNVLLKSHLTSKHAVIK